MIALAGCGRLGFERLLPGDGAAPDAAPDAAPFVEAIGQLDPSFGTNGVVVSSDGSRDLRLFAVVPRAGGYLGVGDHGAAGNNHAFALLAYRADGQSDPAFGTDGLIDSGPTDDDFGYAAVRLDGNRIVVAGDGQDQTPSGDDLTIGIVDDSGAPDPTFGTGGYVRLDFRNQQREDTANRVAIVGSTVIACGLSGWDLTDAKLALVRVDLTGALVTTWGTGGFVTDDFTQGAFDECNDITALGGNVIVAASSDFSRFVVAAYDETTGARAAGFANAGVFATGSGSAGALGIAIVEGDIVAVGQNMGDALVVRLAPDGTPRASFGASGQVALPGIADLLTGVAPQPDGKIVAAGSLGNQGVVVRLLPDGSLDPSFGTGGVVHISGAGAKLELTNLVLDPEGRIVVVGIRGATVPYAAVIARLH